MTNETREHLALNPDSKPLRTTPAGGFNYSTRRLTPEQQEYFMQLEEQRRRQEADTDDEHLIH